MPVQFKPLSYHHQQVFFFPQSQNIANCAGADKFTRIKTVAAPQAPWGNKTHGAPPPHRDATTSYMESNPNQMIICERCFSTSFHIWHFLKEKECTKTLSRLEFSVKYKSYINVKNTSLVLLCYSPSTTQPPWPECVPMYLLRTPPSNEAFKHSGGDNRLWTSATVTLYLDVELRRDNLPGTEQKTSLGFITAPTSSF